MKRGGIAANTCPAIDPCFPNLSKRKCLNRNLPFLVKSIQKFRYIRPACQLHRKTKILRSAGNRQATVGRPPRVRSSPPASEVLAKRRAVASPRAPAGFPHPSSRRGSCANIAWLAYLRSRNVSNSTRRRFCRPILVNPNTKNACSIVFALGTNTRCTEHAIPRVRYPSTGNLSRYDAGSSEGTSARNSAVHPELAARVSSEDASGTP